MIVRYWHPFQEVETLRRQLDKAFNEVGNGLETAPRTWTPAIRLVEAEDTYVLTVQLAGIQSDDIDIQVTREAIAISGDRKQPETAEGTRALYDGIHYGPFRRVVNLPEAVQHNAVEADFSNGLLTVTLPKAEEVRNKVVKVSLGQNESTSEQLPESVA